MRLDPAEIPELPFPGALFDVAGELVAATPEWTGPGPGCLAFATGAGRLVVGPAAAVPSSLEALMDDLLAAVGRAIGAMAPDAGRQASVLLAGLALVSGRPLADTDSGTSADVLDLAAEAISARVPGLAVAVVTEEAARPVPAPAVLALALVQFAANAARHERAGSVRLRAGPGPSFWVDWPSARTSAVPVATARHQARRDRWGWGYARLAADALGGVALPPAPAEEGRVGACLSIGSRMLTLPLACFEPGGPRRCTQSWEQEAVHAEPGLRAAIEAELAGLLGEASGRPGQVVAGELLCARRTGGRTWVALPPETGPDRVRDVLRGLDHERALWSAPEPHASRVHAVTVLLDRAAGGNWPTFDRATWASRFPAACAVRDLTPPRGLEGAAVYPDPRVAAHLLAELGGDLWVADGVVAYRPGRPAAGAAALAALEPLPGGAYALTASLDALFR